MFSTIEEKKAYSSPQKPDEKFHNEDELVENRKIENKLKEKYQISAKPLASNFLQKRLQRGQKFFDSGDYNMAIANKNKPKICQMKELKENSPIILKSQKAPIPDLPNDFSKEPKSYYDTKMPTMNKEQDHTFNPVCKEKHSADIDKYITNVNSDAMISHGEMLCTDNARNASFEQSETTEATGHVIPTPENVPARKASIPLSTVILKAQQPHQLTFPFHHAG